ncbi:MAG: GTPase Era [Saprospiraceae bacterium]|nr:GTPase Era [Saprospiraceae bacterium]MCF8249710.1 GTPase Era [Saprospiraceae bacterium]MCF8282496.1 GTPase Era [Bacteroidales bacterium]MCF8314081.1 GTPase Era [Saprospiraceae bacterium]MCF8442826.1 GTPase Era [Saprospiraceae bacterium]
MKEGNPVHRSGFVNIIGRPNVGKSTLMNTLVGEKMSIITSKPQTTRHRIIGIVSGDDFQMVFSDTPGIISNPAYKMQEAMNRFAASAFEDADLLLFITDIYEKYEDNDPVVQQLKDSEVTKFFILNKIDQAKESDIEAHLKWWSERVDFKAVIPISALKKTNTELMLEQIKVALPEGPEYYPKDQLTDRPERFFVSEIIREKILEQYKQEIPYSTEVVVERFKETKTTKGEDLVEVNAIIYVSRETQKMIILGKNGISIKQLGTEARKSIETWLESKVFLDLHVKVRDNWRNDERMLKHFGYEN